VLEELSDVPFLIMFRLLDPFWLSSMTLQATAEGPGSVSDQSTA